MKRWLNNASSNLKGSRLAGACSILPWIFGADIGAQLGQNLNQFVTGAVGDRLGDEILQVAPTFAATLDPNSIANQLLPGLVGALFTLLLGLLWERRPRRAWRLS